MGASHSSSSSSSGPSELQKQRVGLQNQLGSQLYGTGTQIFGEANPVLAGELNNPVTPGERSDIFQSYMDPFASSYASAADTNAQRAARTRNPAGLLSSADQLARQKGEALSGAAGKAELAALNIGDKRRQMALEGLAKLYGVNLETMGRLLGGMPSPSSKGSSGSTSVSLL